MSIKPLFSLFLVFMLLLVPLRESVAALPEDPPKQSEVSITAPSTGADPEQSLQDAGITSLSGSFVAFDPSVGGVFGYTPGVSQTLCFRSESFTNDWEYVYNNWLKFPSTWVVSNVFVQGTPTCDYGVWGGFSWSFQTSPYEVNIAHTRNQSTTDHCIANYCVEVTPTGTADPALISWFFDGDGYGGTPHNPCSSDGYAPSGFTCDQSTAPAAAVPFELPNVYLLPAEIHTSGCHGVSQPHTFTIKNRTGVDSTFIINYIWDFPGTVTGPESLFLPAGAVLNFTVLLKPHTCMLDGDITVMIEVEDGVYSDTATIYKTVYSEKIGWEQRATNPSTNMDNVTASYDGKVWQVSGYLSGDVSFYEPHTDTWTVVAGSVPPYGTSYPRSGCQIGNKVFVYGDASNLGFTGLWSYNLDTNTWVQETPGGTPPAQPGIWAPAWVADPTLEICYLTGGASVAGGGNLSTVYVYDANLNTWLPQLPNFATVRDFHAAFLFVRPLDGHKLLCVAGGNSANVGISSSQCYDFSTFTWNPENADLGALPLPLWAMGYTMRPIPGGDQLWLINGVEPSGNIINDSWLFDTQSSTWWVMGPIPDAHVYRTSATTLDGTVYLVGGSIGGFTPTGLTRAYVEEICPACSPPSFIKTATEEAMPGSTVNYWIAIDPYFVEPSLMTDTLSDTMAFVPGSLSVNPDVGDYGYDPMTQTVYWEYSPAMGTLNTWTPAAVYGTTNTMPDIQAIGQTAQITLPQESGQIESQVLWDQPLSTVSQNAYANQEFPDAPTYSSFLADDFIADVGWMIDTVKFPGNGWNGFSSIYYASALTFMIYADAGGVPAGDPSGGGAPPVWAISLPPTDPQITITNGTGGMPSNVELHLMEPLLLPDGHYWLIVYPTMSFSPYGQYGRQPADTTNGYTAQFINPGGSFGHGTVYVPWTVLGVTQTDMAFTLAGAEAVPLEISFDALVVKHAGTVTNCAVLIYGDAVLNAVDDTNTGYGTYLPLLLK